MLMRKIDALSDRIRALEENVCKGKSVIVHFEPPFGKCPPSDPVDPPEGQVTPPPGNSIKTRYLFHKVHRNSIELRWTFYAISCGFPI